MTDETQREEPAEQRSVTEGKVTIRGRVVPYRAEAATVTLRDDEGKAKASMFHVAYTRTDVDDAGDRPVTFAFNGGPGSASVWLHMGLFGPRRVQLGDAETPPPPPYRTIENEFSILDVSDLVMIDPVSTGWSRPAGGQDKEQFHGVKEDTESVGEFIRLWTSRNRRWPSPKFLIGESYGTTRAASLAGYLQQRHGMYVNGVALISAVLLFGTIRSGVGNDSPHVHYLPSYATTAWYHGVVRHDSVEALAEEAVDFALGDYATVMLQGSRASEDARRAVLHRTAELTGLAPDFLERCDLRVEPQRFFKELLRERRRTTGRLDSRYTGIDRDAAGERPEYDPSYAMIQGPYTAAVNDHLRTELGFDSDALYEILNGDAVSPWRWGDGAYAETASALRSAMHQNRTLRVLLASGYYDLATPFCAAEWTLDHLQLDRDVRQNVTMRRYPAGHMMYVHEPSLEALRADIGHLIAGTVANG